MTIPARPLRWGILGTGSIAGTFASGLASSTRGVLHAVGSRSHASAERFATTHRIARVHASYQALAEDGEVDAVYIASPHPQHVANAELCLRAGKAVLCEKPLTVNATQGEQLVALSQRHRRFLMEAMWTRFLPAITQVRRWLSEGAIGEVRMLQADFGFRCGWDPQSRLLDVQAAGGGLLDVGVYTVALARMVFGASPERIQALAHLGESGVDEQVAVVCGWTGGRLGLLSSAVRTETPQSAWIAGTEGRIELPQFWQGRVAILHRSGAPPQSVTPPFVGNGYHYQADEVARCIAEGLIESPLMSHAESLENLRTMDAIRAQIGLRYPFESTTTSSQGSTR